MARRSFSRWVLPVVCAALELPASAADSTALTPFKDAAPEPPAPWHFVGLPGQTKPKTRFSIVEQDGRRAVRVEAEESYGNIVHPVKLRAPSTLSWQWQVEAPVPGADLRTRQGDDTAVKVCVFFDMDLDLVPFLERQLQKVAQSKTTEPLPNATVAMSGTTTCRSAPNSTMPSRGACDTSCSKADPPSSASGNPRSATWSPTSSSSSAPKVPRCRRSSASRSAPTPTTRIRAASATLPTSRSSP